MKERNRIRRAYRQVKKYNCNKSISYPCAEKWCILKPQPTGPLLEGSLIPVLRCSRCILQPSTDWSTRWGSLTPVQSMSRCILQLPADWSTRWGSLTTVTYSYADACRNIFNTIKTSGHSSLEKYTSHFIWKASKGLRKVLSVRGELETEQDCNILTPTISGHSIISFPLS